VPRRLFFLLVSSPSTSISSGPPSADFSRAKCARAHLAAAHGLLSPSTLRTFFFRSLFVPLVLLFLRSSPGYTCPSIRGGFPLTGSERRTTQRFSMRLPLTVRWTIGLLWRNQHRVPRLEFPRGLLLPCQGRQGRFCRGNPSDAPNEITLAGPVRVRCLGRVQRTEPRDELLRGRRGRDRAATNFCARRRKLTLFAAFFQVKILGLKVETSFAQRFRKWFGKSSFSRSSCSLTAECGQDKRGALPLSEAPGSCSSRCFFAVLPNFWAAPSLYSSHLLYFRAGDFLSPFSHHHSIKVEPRRPRGSQKKFSLRVLPCRNPAQKCRCGSANCRSIRGRNRLATKRDNWLRC